ncbi:MAG: ribosome small subunit-dependent GTPase A [Gammaproteobacteria bacterium]|nr:ribosome small subunit-dependent GTPase A [Gammaproteobacteria bacterium]MDH4254282.1 ribosome small subunit-dependent GTPase A [Gammaproteobacteria bacterium]MDH5309135.1 ribosome small subunit-dependent GTPase A [Gammaproteobacteria bacterium]
MANERIARVAAVDRDQLLLIDETGSFRAKLSGNYLYRHRLAQELPCVGDWVCVEKHPGDDLGLIHSLLQRRTMLRRKAAGRAVEYQMIAANVDYVFIVQSCHFDFNIRRLERYLVMARDGGAEPCCLLTKTDLVEPSVLASQLAEIRAAGITAPVITLSNVTREGIDDLRRFLLPGKTYCFVGSSGVGKTTLINQLIGSELYETKSVSGTGEGRHTTVRRELVALEGGALVIDNPGMREFGILAADGGLSGSFADIDSLGPACRYRDCTHTSEPGCAVLEAVESGEIGQEHYDSYIKLRKESEFHQMSHAEKRRKERDFGRFIKSATKHLKKR